MAGGAADSADQQDSLLHLFRGPQLGGGDGFDQRHAEAVGSPDDEMPAIRDLPAAVLLDAHLGDGQVSTAKGQAAIHSDDGGALKAGGYGSVQILLAGDVHLVDDVAAQHEALLDGDVQRPWVDEKRG